MNNELPTLGIYGIQDRIDTEYPQLVHDHGLAKMHHGKIEDIIQLERITRKKRDHKLHQHLTGVIAEKNWIESNMDVVFVDNVVGRSFISSDGQIRFEAPLTKRLTKDWEEGRLWWFNREINGYILNHELAHIFSCLPFFGEFKENSLLIHFDGGASFSNFSAWIYRMGKIIPVEHHWELKHLSSLFNANALTFGIIGAKYQEKNSVPGKLMEYSALGNYSEEIEFWLRQNNWFENIWNQRSLFFESAKSEFNIDLKSFDLHHTFLQDVAATIQEIFMRETLMKIDDVNTLSNCRNLYYTGGCALNIQTNSSIIDSQLFDNVYIPPCTGDSGLALGAAAFGEWKKGHTFQEHSPYLNNWELENSHFEYNADDVQQAANLLTQGKVIGICNGLGEIGPHALGNRSILALPTKALAKKVSVQHKNREWYRPTKSVMLETNAKYFTGKSSIHPLSKYMLLDFKIIPEKQHEIDGVIHANGKSCFQTLFDKNDNPYLFDLLTLLNDQFNVKALINTSFNTQEEAIVHNQNEAKKSAGNMKIDAIVINGKVQLL